MDFFLIEKFLEDTLFLALQTQLSVISQILSLSDIDLLNESAFWQERIQQKFPEALEQINVKYTVILEDANKYFDMDDLDKKTDFLEEHTDLKSVLQELPLQNPSILDAAKLIGQKRKQEIVNLGTLPS